MPELLLIYFEGCPTASKARVLLENTGRPFREVRQDDLPAGDPMKGYTSPSILMGEQVIYGEASREMGCSIAALNEVEIISALKATGA